MKTILQLKEDWKKYLAENQIHYRKISNHHYFRTRKASSFWLKEIEKIYQEIKNETSTRI